MLCSKMDDFKFVLLTSLASTKGKMSKKKQENLLKAGNFFPPPGHASALVDEDGEHTKIYTTGGYRKGAPTKLDSLLVETSVETTEDNIEILSARSCNITGSYKSLSHQAINYLYINLIIFCGIYARISKIK